MILLFSVVTALYWILHGRHVSELAFTDIWGWYLEDRWGDFWHYKKLLKQIHTPEFFAAKDRFAYPAPCAILYQAFYALPRPHLLYDALLLAAMAASAAWFYRLLTRFDLPKLPAAALTLLVAGTSYPWLVLYERSNLELFVYILLALGLWAMLSGRPLLAAVLWGAAGALKLYPLAMLGVYLNRRTVRGLAVGLASFAASLLASFAYVGPTIATAARGTLAGTLGFVGNYAANARHVELIIDHSIMGTIKELLTTHFINRGTEWPGLSRTYEIGAGLLLVVLVAFVVRKLPLLNQVSFYLVVIALFPPVSYDYTLVHVYLAMAMVCGTCLMARQQGVTLKHERVFFIAFALLATAQNFLHIGSLRLNGPIKCGALLALFVLLQRVPLSMGLPVEKLWRGLERGEEREAMGASG